MDRKIISQSSIIQIPRNLLVEQSRQGVFGKFLNNPASSVVLNWLLDQIFKEVLYDRVSLRRVKYLSSDARGDSCVLSGLVISPLGDDGQPAKSSLMGFQHGTQIERILAPSCYDKRKPLDFMEVLIAAAFAMNGYTVAMADYQGMGMDKGEHPYMNAHPLALAVADLLLGIKEDVHLNRYLNNQLFLVGYSEGGYATMATAREIQLNPKYSLALQITAAAPLAGPYDLSGTMRQLMLRNEAFGDGYYLPMTIRGFYAVYGDQYGEGIFTKEKALKPEYQILYDLVDGYHSLEEVQQYMPAVPRDILSVEFIRQLEDTSSDVCRALKDNDLYNWNPKMPIYLYHDPRDDRVPFANSLMASENFKRKGRMVPIVPLFSLPIPGPVHIKASPVCFLASSVWFKIFRT